MPTTSRAIRMVAAIPVTYDLGMLKILVRGPFEVSTLSDWSKLINPEIDEYFCSLCLSSESDCSISRISADSASLSSPST